MTSEWKKYWQRVWVETKIALFVTAFSTLVFFAAYYPVIPAGRQHVNLLVSFAFSFSVFIFVWILFVLFYGFLSWLHSKGRAEFKYLKEANLLLSIFGMGVGAAIGAAVKAKVLEVQVAFSSLWFSALFGVFIAFMFHFYYSYKNSKKENLQLRVKQAESKLHVLKNQMQPHFLFNSLNSLLQLIETKSELAPEMAMDLSDLYRHILENSQKVVVSLDSELSIVEKYLKLEKLRFGRRLQYQIKVPQESQNIFVPPLLLQTLAENAIKHGISTKPEGGEVIVLVEKDGDGYLISISNSGELRSSKKEIGVGLSNSISRLNLLYDTRHRFSMQMNEGKVLTSFWISGDYIEKT